MKDQFSMIATRAVVLGLLLGLQISTAVVPDADACTKSGSPSLAPLASLRGAGGTPTFAFGLSAVASIFEPRDAAAMDGCVRSGRL